MARNHLPGCQTFSAMGYCERFAPLAHRYCRLSCELCTLRGQAVQAHSSTVAPLLPADRPSGAQEAFSGVAVPQSALKDVHGEDGTGTRVEGQGFHVSRERRGILRRVSRSISSSTHQSWLLSR